jgi:hypothetical protein
MVSRFYDAHGYVPERLTPDLIQTANKAFMSSEMQDVYRNPFTGEWPRLNPMDAYQPGDLVIRPLTGEEMQHFAALNPHYKDVWFGTRMINPITNAEAVTQLDTKVFYVRVYGSKSTPIESGLKYIYSLH